MFLSLLQFFATKFLFLALHLESGSFPRPLSPQEEIKTFSALREGDPSAREKLIRHNLRLVAHIAKKYYALPSEQDDLISIGTIGLMKAVDTFDSTRRARFSTYASRCIENAILSPAHFGMEKRIPTLTPTSRTHGTVCVSAAMVLTCCKKRLLPWWAWRNGSIGIWKAAHFTAASRPNLRTSSPPFTVSRWRIFWTTTPCFCTGGGGAFLRRYREAKGWNRQQLADHAKVGCTSIRTWENGQKSISHKCFDLLVENLGHDFTAMLHM